MTTALADQYYVDAELAISKATNYNEILATSSFIPYILSQLNKVFTLSNISIYLGKFEKIEGEDFMLEFNTTEYLHLDINDLIPKYQEIEMTSLQRGFRITGIVPYGNIGIRMGDNRFLSYKYFSSDNRHKYDIPKKDDSYTLYDIEGMSEFLGIFIEIGNPYLDEKTILQVATATDLIYQSTPMSIYMHELIEKLKSEDWQVDNNPML